MPAEIDAEPKTDQVNISSDEIPLYAPLSLIRERLSVWTFRSKSESSLLRVATVSRGH
jgi:hypothetical protein